jgi:DNA-binding transcriptional regulator YhcF (GntR family)
MSPGQLDRTPVYQQVADFYAARIRAGEIAAGEKLPSYTELHQIWRIAQQTAFTAYAVLRREGLAETSRKGTFAIVPRAQ